MKFKRKRFKSNRLFFEWLEKSKNEILLYEVKVEKNKVKALYEVKGGLNGKNNI